MCPNPNPSSLLPQPPQSPSSLPATLSPPHPLRRRPLRRPRGACLPCWTLPLSEQHAQARHPLPPSSLPMLWSSRGGRPSPIGQVGACSCPLMCSPPRRLPHHLANLITSTQIALSLSLTHTQTFTSLSSVDPDARDQGAGAPGWCRPDECEAE